MGVVSKSMKLWEQVQEGAVAIQRGLWGPCLLVKRTGEVPIVQDVLLSNVRFSQCSVYPVLTGIGGMSIDEFAEELRKNGWDITKDPPRAVLWPNGFVQCWDHRRVVAAKIAGLPKIPFQLFRPEDPLPEDPTTHGHLKVDVPQTQQQLAAGLVGKVGPFQAGSILQNGAKASTWGDAVVFRSALQANFGDKDFPLLGQIELPSIQWDLQVEYRAHCKRLLELPPGSAIIYFKPKRKSMFLMRSKHDLACWMRDYLALSGTLEAEGQGLLRVRFHEDWQEVAKWLVRWCNEVLAIDADGVKSIFERVVGGITARFPIVDGIMPGDVVKFTINSLEELSAQQAAQAVSVQKFLPEHSGCVAVRGQFELKGKNGEPTNKSMVAAVAWSYPGAALVEI